MDENREGTVRILAVLSAAYPGFDLKPATIEIYLQSLSDIPLWLLEKVALRHIKFSKFFPTIAELRAMLAEMLLEAYSSGQPPYEAWEQVHSYIVLGDKDSWKEIPSEAREVVIALGGAHRFRISEHPESQRARFIEAYTERRERLRRDMILKPGVWIDEILELSPNFAPNSVVAQLPATTEKQTGEG